MNPTHNLGILSQVSGIWIYVVIFLLILVQECGVPFPVLPSEVVLLGGGFLAYEGKISLVVAGAVAMMATLIGNSVLYYVGRRFGRAALDRYGKYINLRPERVDRIEAWVERSGTPILFYGPLVPILRAYVPALAGMFGVGFRLYISVLVGAAFLWSFGLLIIGQVLGDSWLDAVHFLRHNLLVGLLLGVAGIVAALMALRWRRSKERLRDQKWRRIVAEPARAGATIAEDAAGRWPGSGPIGNRTHESTNTVRLAPLARELQPEDS